ncbi:MAG: hypothetical protein KC620_26560, partial [Myxococcales bacterium]|nr:hypothetical protein [Myxococcales bacterium]
YTQQGPATRAIGRLTVIADQFSTLGTEPTGTLTLMAGVLKGQVDEGIAAFEASGSATVMAGLLNVNCNAMTIAGGVDEEGAIQPASLSAWLAGLLLLNPKMLTFPAVKALDPIVGLDFHFLLPSLTPIPLPPLPPQPFPTPFMGPILTGIHPTVLVNFRPAAVANSIALSFHMPPLPWPWVPFPSGSLLKTLVLTLIQIPFSIVLNTVKAGLQSMLAEKVPALRSGFVGDFL